MSKKKQVSVKKHTLQYISFIKTLLHESAQMLIRHGESTIDAARISKKFVVEVTRRLAGSAVYISKNTFMDAELKYRQIRADFHNGATIEQLADGYSLTSRRIRTILFETKDNAAIKAGTTGAAEIAIVATAMFIHSGCGRENAVSATRGLLAVIAAKHGGEIFYSPALCHMENTIRSIEINTEYQSGKSVRSLSERYKISAEDIEKIIAAYPVAPLPNAKELPKIRRQLQIMTGNFTSYSEINTLLGEATERINRVEEIIKNLERSGKTQAISD